MSLNITIAATVTLPDGQNLIQVMQVDTSINPDPTDSEAESLLASARFDSLLSEVQETVHERFIELTALIKRIE